MIVRLGEEPLVLPAELAQAAVGAASNRTAPRMFVESIEQEWVYPGARAGHHMAPDTLQRPAPRWSASRHGWARTSALIALAQEVPPVVLSRLTGLDISSAIACSNAIGANNNAYAAAVIERAGMTIPTFDTRPSHQAQRRFDL